MAQELKDIIQAALCELTIGVDGDGQLIQHIADKTCQQPCGHCLMTADYIVNKIEEGSHEQQPA